MKSQTNIRLANIDHILVHCGSIKAEEHVLILCNPETRDIADAFKTQAFRLTQNIQVIEMACASSHGDEPSSEAGDEMMISDLTISLCIYSLAHSRARFEAAACGGRFLSLPMYSWDLLDNEAICVNYRALRGKVESVANKISNARRIQVTTEIGTDVILGALGRIGNACPGYVAEAGDLGSPPDVEANVAPLERETEGLIVVDGSITTPELGLLPQPLRLNIKGGRVTQISGGRATDAATLDALLGDTESKRRVVGELGIGLNPKARLTGIMLTDEGCSGCVHFGLGSNSTIGGQNDAGYHLDVVIRAATIDVDGSRILDKGEIII